MTRVTAAQFWTEERVCELVDLWNAGKMAHEVAEIFGVTPSAVNHQVTQCREEGRKIATAAERREIWKAEGRTSNAGGKSAPDKRRPYELHFTLPNGVIAHVYADSETAAWRTRAALMTVPAKSRPVARRKAQAAAG